MEGLPRQVQDARREADAIMAHLKGDTSTEAAPETKDTEITPAPEETQKPQPQPQVDNYEAKFHTLRGKYDAEVPRLHDLVRTLEDRIRQLEADAAQKPQEQTARPEASVNRDAVAAYDDEFGKMYDLVQAQKAQIDALRSEIATVKGSVGQVHEAQALTAQGLYEQELTKLVPDHKELNADPDFNAWLNEEDGFSGNTRRANGLAAVNALDHVKVARMYNEFKSSRKVVEPSPPPNRSFEPATTSTTVDTAQYQQQQQGGTFTSAEVDEMYRRRRENIYPFQWRGVIFKSDAETKPYCAEIQRAGIEGRIR